MAITFEKQSFGGRFPEIWRGECKMLPGGFKPTQEFAPGTVVRRATPVFVNFDEMSATVCKVASVLDGGTTTKVRVPKGHYFTKGDNVFKYGAEAPALVTVNEVDRTNSAYDFLTLSKAITDIAKDDVLVEGKSVEGETQTVKAVCEPNMVVGADKQFDGKGLPTLDAAFEAVVLYPSLQFPILKEWLQGVALKNNPNIIFIKQ
nr:MAG TPA: Head fiber protein [Caudoviricetes sp.]